MADKKKNKAEKWRGVRCGKKRERSELELSGHRTGSLREKQGIMSGPGVPRTFDTVHYAGSQESLRTRMC